MPARGLDWVEVGAAGLYVMPRSVEPTAMLWIHGGGLVVGAARRQLAHQRALAAEVGLWATAEYRLAPEHPFPAALDDLEAAFHWLVEQPGIERVAVGGLSAGGGLAAALCQRLRDAGGAQPVFQLLVYPMLDDRSAHGHSPDDAHLRLWDRPSNALGWSSYLAGQAPTTPHAVPARADDLSGLPPAWIGVGTLDLFHDESVAYAERLRAAGVDATLDVVPGAYHSFDEAEPNAPVSQAFRASQRQALARAMAPADGPSPWHAASETLPPGTP